MLRGNDLAFLETKLAGGQDEADIVESVANNLREAPGSSQGRSGLAPCMAPAESRGLEMQSATGTLLHTLGLMARIVQLGPRSAPVAYASISTSRRTGLAIRGHRGPVVPMPRDLEILAKSSGRVSARETWPSMACKSLRTTSTVENLSWIVQIRRRRGQAGLCRLQPGRTLQLATHMKLGCESTKSTKAQ